MRAASGASGGTLFRAEFSFVVGALSGESDHASNILRIFIRSPLEMQLRARLAGPSSNCWLSGSAWSVPLVRPPYRMGALGWGGPGPPGCRCRGLPPPFPPPPLRAVPPAPRRAGTPRQSETTYSYSGHSGKTKKQDIALTALLEKAKMKF